MKEQLKEKQDLFREQEKETREQHSGMIELEAKWRKLTQLIKAHNKASDSQAVSDIDTNEITKIK